MWEDIGLIRIIIPTDVSHNVGHIKCTADKSYFHSNREENDRCKKIKFNIKRKLLSTHKSFYISKNVTVKILLNLR